MKPLSCPACALPLRMDELKRFPPDQPRLSRAMNRRFCAHCGCEVALRERSGISMVSLVLAIFLGFFGILFAFDPPDFVKLALSLVATGGLFFWTQLGKRLVKVEPRTGQS